MDRERLIDAIQVALHLVQPCQLEHAPLFQDLEEAIGVSEFLGSDLRGVAAYALSSFRYRSFDRRNKWGDVVWMAIARFLDQFEVDASRTGQDQRYVSLQDVLSAELQPRLHREALAWMADNDYEGWIDLVIESEDWNYDFVRSIDVPDVLLGLAISVHGLSQADVLRQSDAWKARIEAFRLPVISIGDAWDLSWAPNETSLVRRIDRRFSEGRPDNVGARRVSAWMEILRELVVYREIDHRSKLIVAEEDAEGLAIGILRMFATLGEDGCSRLLERVSALRAEQEEAFHAMEVDINAELFEP